MKKQLLTFTSLSLITLWSFGQVTMTKILPPSGTGYSLSKVSSVISKASYGGFNVYDYSSVTTTPILDFQFIGKSQVSQALQDSFPDVSYIEMANTGAPDINLNPMNFIKDMGTFLETIGQKNSGNSMSRKSDTLAMFNQSYQSTLFYRGSFVYYGGYGLLKVKSKNFDSVALVINTKPGSTDTVVTFVQFKPYFRTLFAYNIVADTIQSAYFYEPSLPTGLDQVKESEFAMYPNPASASVFIDIKSSNGYVEIFDLQGRSLIHKEIMKSGNVNTENLPKGIYIVKVETESGIQTRKLSIE